MYYGLLAGAGAWCTPYIPGNFVDLGSLNKCAEAGLTGSWSSYGPLIAFAPPLLSVLLGSVIAVGRLER